LPLKHDAEGKIEGTGRRGRRCKQLLNDFKEKRRYYALYALLFLENAVNLSHDRLLNE